MSLLVMMPAMLIGGMVASVTVALLTERFAYRPLRNAPRLAPLITAIGISVLLQEAVRLFYDRPGLFVDWNPLEFPSAKSKISFPQIEGVTGAAWSLGGVSLARPALFTIASLLVSAAFLWWFVNRTRTGRGMQAVSQDPDTARLMGVDVDRIIVVSFALGAALAAIAGVAQGLQDGTIGFRMGFLYGLKAFTAAVLGGIGNIQGAVVGGIALGIVEAFATNLFPSDWKDVWAFGLLIVFLVFRPQGIMGARVVDRA